MSKRKVTLKLKKARQKDGIYPCIECFIYDLCAGMIKDDDMPKELQCTKETYWSLGKVKE